MSSPRPGLREMSGKGCAGSGLAFVSLFVHEEAPVSPSELLAPQVQEPPRQPDRVQAQERTQGPGVTQCRPHCIHQLLQARGLGFKQRHLQAGGDAAADIQLGPDGSLNNQYRESDFRHLV